MILSSQHRRSVPNSVANFPHQRVGVSDTAIDSPKQMDSRTAVSRITCLVGSLCVAMLLPCAAIGHHTFAYVYNTSQVAEIVGEVIDVQWESPHVRFRMRTDDGDVWSIESNSPAGMERRTVTRELVGVGRRFRLAGFPARDGSNGLHASNILLEENTEVVLRPGSRPRWTAQP